MRGIGTRSVGPTAARWAVAKLLPLICRQSEDHAALAAAARLTVDDLDAPHERLALEDYLGFLECCVRYARDPWLGLHMAQHPELTRLGLLGPIFHSATSLRDAAGRMDRFGCLWAEGMRLHVEERGDEAWFVTECHLPAVYFGTVGLRVLLEFAMGALVIGARRALGCDLVASASMFATAAPADPRPLREVFGPAISFGASRSVVVLPAKYLDRPFDLNRSNREIGEVVRELAESLVSRRPLEGKVYDVLARALRDGEGFPAEKEITDLLGMGPRSLQRALAQEGRQFREIRDQVRSDFIEAALREDSLLSHAEIARRAGFSSASAMQRFYKKLSENQSPRVFHPRKVVAR